jgi:hypothetical protein
MKSLTDRSSIEEEQKKAGLFLYILLVIDMFFIAMHILYGGYHYLNGSMDEVNRVYLLSEDQGYAEVFQYVKEIFIGIILVHLFVVERKVVFLGWAFLFFYFFIDDCFFFHERVGWWLAKNLHLPEVLTLRALDLGELLVSGFAGLFLFGFIIYSTFKNNKFLPISLDYAVLLIILIFFGVGMDMLHIMINNKNLGYLFTILEDGGEMLAMSLICWYTSCLKINQKNELLEKPSLINSIYFLNKYLLKREYIKN